MSSSISKSCLIQQLRISSELMGLCITRWIQPQLQTQFLWNLMMRERAEEKELFLLSSPSAFSPFFWFRPSISQQLPTCWLSTLQSNTHCPLGWPHYPPIYILQDQSPTFSNLQELVTLNQYPNWYLIALTLFSEAS